MGAKRFMTSGYKLIVRFFKEVGFYKEFLGYCKDPKRIHANFYAYEEDPLKNFGSTSISNWIEEV